MRAAVASMPRVLSFSRITGLGVGIAIGGAILVARAAAVLRAGSAALPPPINGPTVAGIAFILFGLAALAKPETHAAGRVAAQSAAALAILLVLASLSDTRIGTAILPHLLYRDRLPPGPMPADWPPGVGITSAASLLLLGLGEFLLQYRHPRAGQALLAAAAGGSLLQLLGYAAQLPPFQHDISLLVGLAGIASTTAVLAGAARSGFIAALAGDGQAARFARTTLAWTTVGALLIGWVIARFVERDQGTLTLAETLLVLAWIWTVGILAMLHASRMEPRPALATAQPGPDAPSDALTGLLSRNGMHALIADQRHRPEQAAIIMIDIDRFRAVNNFLGTDTGDALLAQAGQRLLDLAAPHPVARAGGNEFAILCNGVDAAAANRLSAAAVEVMAAPFRLGDGRLFHISASVGLAHGATEGIRDLRDAADEAMHIAKSQGGNQFVSFIGAPDPTRAERVALEQDLHRACKSSSELFLMFQPIISLRDRRIVSIEALARWRHPQSGLLAPGRFVPIAETAGMMLGLGAKLRELAVIQAARWRDETSTRLPVVNLNVSPLELARADVPASLGALLDRYGLPRDGFCLEVTEGSFTDERAVQSLRAARAAGFRIAMDDFGVGYSSLAQLPRLPLTSIKLDRSFVHQALESEDGVSLFATMVQLAHVLKLPVTAEGVETAKALRIISDCGCDAVQGFLFARPLSPAELEPWLQPGFRAELRLA